MLPDYARKAVVGTVSAIDITKDVYVVSPVSPVTTGAKAYSPPDHRKGKLVFFQHGLGADWKEFAMTIAGTSSGHESWDTLKPLGFKKYGVPEYSLPQKIEGLVQKNINSFWDAGVISERKTTKFSSFLDGHCTHSCQLWDKEHISEMLRKGKIVCIKTEFSSGVKDFETQRKELLKMVTDVETAIASDIEYDVAFVGHSMGGLASINYGIDYAEANKNTGRKVKIITVSTPYYENLLASFEADLEHGLLWRGNEGAQEDLAGFTPALFKLQKKWNTHITGEGKGITTLSAIGIDAKDEAGSLEWIDSEIKKCKSTDNHWYQALIEARENIYEGGSDYIVPIKVQLGKMTDKMKKTMIEVQYAIKEKGLDEFLRPYREKADKAERDYEYWKSIKFYSTLENEKMLHNNKIKSAEFEKKRADNLCQKMAEYDGLEEYKMVNALLTVFGPEAHHILGTVLTDDNYHHVNTPDLQKVIDGLASALIGAW